MTHERLLLKSVLRRVRTFSAIAATINGLMMIAPAAQAQTYTVLHSFCSLTNCTDGSSPDQALVQATNGYLYGSTDGSAASLPGTVFKMTTGGTLNTLYTFCASGGSPCDEGEFPSSAVIQAPNGNLYGATNDGTIFDLAPKSFTTVNVGVSATGLIQQPNGQFFGTSISGGAYDDGSAFSVLPNGTVTTLYSFCSAGGSTCPDGSAPNQLVHATNGNLYGTTQAGGINGGGTIFALTPSGAYSLVFSFPSGSASISPLIQASGGALYGTLVKGGTHGYGSVFAISPTGTYKNVYNFCSVRGAKFCADGALPATALIQASDGNLYGTTIVGGTNNKGSIFKLTTSGVLTTLYSFCSQTNCADGNFSNAALIQASDGKIYGTLNEGGAQGFGVAFSLDVGLGPLAVLQTIVGNVGSTVRILGNNLTGATSVTFNGVSATFTVNSTGSSITTTVPAGATTGTVLVTTPTGTLKSNVAYTVK